MAVKEWFRRLRPVQLYLVLFFTVAFFAVEIVASYATHALTLLMNAYHMLCNIVALLGCIASIKYESESRPNHESSMDTLKAPSKDSSEKSLEQLRVKKTKQMHSDKRMKSTFGWARIDILTMLVCCVLLASFCFSLIVEGLQTLVHIDHLDAMHYPLPVMSIGASGILLNAFCYFLIGGYTFNQGIFLHFTHDGNVILKRSVSSDSPRKPEAEQTRRSPIMLSRSQGLREMCRDVLGCVLVIVASGLVYVTDGQVAKYVDPIIAIVSAVSLFLLSYPYMKESGMILLQTIPNHINIDSLQKDLLAAFPDIISVHDLHVWQLNGEKVVSTVHIIYADPTVCARITDQITSFFIEMGITHVTIQPEFCKMIQHVSEPSSSSNADCLIRCQSKNCSASTCCSAGGDAGLHHDDDDHHDHDDHQHHQHHRLDDDDEAHRHEHRRQILANKRLSPKEIARTSGADLRRSFTVQVSEINETPRSRASSSASAAAAAVEGQQQQQQQQQRQSSKPTSPRETTVEVIENDDRGNDAPASRHQLQRATIDVKITSVAPHAAAGASDDAADATPTTLARECVVGGGEEAVAVT